MGPVLWEVLVSEETIMTIADFSRGLGQFPFYALLVACIVGVAVIGVGMGHVNTTPPR